jgi:molecular chaperone HtpG
MLMQRIELPRSFADRLNGSDLVGPLNSSLDHCNQFFGDPTRGLPFFPEYTDHRLTHVQGVLDSCCQLLTPEALAVLTPEDIAVLCVGVLLHDAAMHLTEEGFLDLIGAPGVPPLFPDLDSLSWPEEWAVYLAEASRWDGRRLHAVLGDITANSSHQEEDLAQFVRSPIAMGSVEKWPKAYNKFVGEFIRQHHPRLAHEFALRGAPGAGGCRYRLIEAVERHPIDDLGGLVARSHGMALRDTFRYLRSKYHAVHYPRNTHIVFLMVVLRIADYLQVESGRAPRASLKVRSLHNPTSVREWAVHQSIKDVMLDENDAQAFMVVAEPPDSRTYVRARSVLDGLQQELDTSWAVLGEVYSKQEVGTNLGITLRRVRSNLDNLVEFRKTVNYLPGQFAFEAAGTGLLKKLVGPLYGDAPEVGIRELLQNAIDAVNEFYGLSGKTAARTTSGDGKADIWICVDGSAESRGYCNH